MKSITHLHIAFVALLFSASCAGGQGPSPTKSTSTTPQGGTSTDPTGKPQQPNDASGKPQQPNDASGTSQNGNTVSSPQNANVSGSAPASPAGDLLSGDGTFAGGKASNWALDGNTVVLPNIAESGTYALRLNYEANQSTTATFDLTFGSTVPPYVQLRYNVTFSDPNAHMMHGIVVKDGNNKAVAESVSVDLPKGYSPGEITGLGVFGGTQASVYFTVDNQGLDPNIASQPNSAVFNGNATVPPMAPGSYIEITNISLVPQQSANPAP